MSDALENAYLVLLGQIAIIATAVAFGVPYFLSLPDIQRVAPNATTTFFLIFVFSASALMIINIIIGWAALRSAIRNPKTYTNKMFVIDLFIVVVLFAMNNVIMFAFGDTLSLQNTSTVKVVIEKGVSITTIAFMASALYSLTAVFLLLCKLWNTAYYMQAGTINYSVYERILWVIIGVLFLLCIMAVIYRTTLCVQVALFCIWVFSWVYINGHWLLTDFLSQSNTSSGTLEAKHDVGNVV